MARKSPRSKNARTPGLKAPVAPLGRSILEAALNLAQKCRLDCLILFVDGLENPDDLKVIDFDGDVRIILVTRLKKMYECARRFTKQVVRLPSVQLTRLGQIKIAAMLSFSQRYLNPGDRFVYLTGLEPARLDTLMIMEVGQEYELFQSVDQPPLTEHIRRAVFERVLNLALELASEGREGKPVGAIFVLGDSQTVLKNARQNIINPFRGYSDAECNLMDAQMTETIKEFSTIDGAFVIKGTGVIASAGTYLLPKILSEDLPQGLGSRHAAAAAITAATRSIAITISESTGTVRIWRQGRLITEIEKAKHLGAVTPVTDES